jgi:DNA mismatch repair protein MutH
MQPPPLPANIQALQTSARSLVGRSVGELARELNQQPPDQPTRAKGWTGRLIEIALGAPADAAAGPDLAHLGIELKSLPLDRSGKPKESTWVCMAPMDGRLPPLWRDSPPWHKLCHVLWIPIQAEPSIPFLDRRIGVPFLWRPDTEEEAELAADYAAILELIAHGELAHLDARVGKALQVRPKAADGSQTTLSWDGDGCLTTTRPRGFYLRRGFTTRLLDRQFAR